MGNLRNYNKKLVTILHNTTPILKKTESCTLPLAQDTRNFVLTSQKMLWYLPLGAETFFEAWESLIKRVSFLDTMFQQVVSNTSLPTVALLEMASGKYTLQLVKFPIRFGIPTKYFSAAFFSCST